MDAFGQMREFIMAAENLSQDETAVVANEPLADASCPPSYNVALLDDLHQVVFKLRAFMESSSGDYALGVECGMQRAAEMIENVIRRHFNGGEFD